MLVRVAVLEIVAMAEGDISPNNLRELCRFCFGVVSYLPKGRRVRRRTYPYFREGVRGVYIGQILCLSDEVGSTLPRREEEPLNPSYAAAERVGTERGSLGTSRTESAQAA